MKQLFSLLKNKARWFSWCIIMPSLFFWCNLASAAEQKTHFFALPKDDLSLTLLQTIFGDMGGTLGTTSKTIFYQLFKTFNQAMVTLAAIVLIYTVIMSIINTAHQGEFLGRKFDSMWVPIRSILGILLVFPTATGYSVIQILMMKIVLLGMGAADSIWTSALNYLADPNANLPTGSIAIMNVPSADYAKLAHELVITSVCIYNAYSQAYGTFPNEALSMKDLNMTSATSTGSGPVKTKTYNFNCDYTTKSGAMTGIYCGKGNTDSSRQTVLSVNCGSISWQQVTDDNNFKLYNTGQDIIPNKLGDTYDKNIPAIMDKLLAIALTAEKTDEAPIDTTFTNFDDPGSNILTPFMQDVSNYQTGDGLKYILEAYAGALHAQAPNNISGKDALKIFTNNIKGGWIMAGSLFYQLAEISNALNRFGDLTAITYNAGDESQTDTDYVKAKNLTEGLGSGLLTQGQHPEWSALWSTVLTPMIWTAEGIITGNAGTSNIINNNFDTGKLNPLIAIQLLGNRIVHTAEIVWALAMIFMVGSALIAGLCSGASPLALVFTTVSKYLMVPIMMGIGLLFVSGLTMSVYIPLVPFIIFTFAALGWLINVFETILAAPLIALGIAHPAGANEVVGIAAPSIMLVLNVFIRPSFMILSLIGGMLISTAGVMLLNVSMKVVITTMNISLDPVQMLFLLTIYVSLVIIILNKSYGIITTSADDVLRFIGGQASLGSEKGSGEQEARQAFGGAAGTGGKAFDHGASGLSKNSDEGFKSQAGMTDKAAKRSAVSDDKLQKAKAGGTPPGGGTAPPAPPPPPT